MNNILELSYNKLIIFFLKKESQGVKKLSSQGVLLSKLYNFSISSLYPNILTLTSFLYILFTIWLFHFSHSFFTYLFHSFICLFVLPQYYFNFSNFKFVSSFYTVHLGLCLYLGLGCRLIDEKFMFTFAHFECINIR